MMRVITCADCGRPVSDTERVCPYCGCPVNISINNMLKEKRAKAAQSNRTGRRTSSSGQQHTTRGRLDLEISRPSGRSSDRAAGTAVQSRNRTRAASSKAARAKAVRRKALIKLSLTALAFIVFLALIIFGIAKCSGGKDSVTAQPVYDQSGFVYYANKNDAGRLYKAVVSGDNFTKEQKLSEFVPTELLLDGEWLYYTNAKRDDNIYRISTQGLDESLVYDSGARNLEIVNGYLIFDNAKADYNQYKIKLSEIETNRISVATVDEGESNPPASQSASQAGSGQNSQAGASTGQSSQGDLMQFSTGMIVKNSKLVWSLKLANASNPLPVSFDKGIETSALQNGKKVDKRIKTKLNEMMDNMVSEISNCNIYVSSSYRTVATQQALFDRKVESLVSEGMTQQEAEAKAVETVSRAGASDHNTGLSVDFNDGAASFSNTKEYEWLKENAHKYGFVERYPQNGESKTGCKWEPYHYRFVGSEAAQIMHDENLTLEEYIFKYCPDSVVPEE